MITDGSIKVLCSEDLKPELIEQLAKWNEMFDLTEDKMLLVALHYKWKEDRMYDWFNDSEKLQYQIGIKPNLIVEQK